MQLLDLVVEFEITPENTYNMDETGFVMGNAQSRRIIDIVRHPRDLKGPLFPADLKDLNLPPKVRIQDGSREFTTVICCICADGTALDPAIIMKAQDMQDSWFSDVDGAPDNIPFGVSPNGWTDSSKALGWLEHNFGPKVYQNKKQRESGGCPFRWPYSTCQ